MVQISIFARPIPSVAVVFGGTSTRFPHLIPLSKRGSLTILTTGNVLLSRAIFYVKRMTDIIVLST